MSNESVVIDPIIRQMMESAAIGEAAKLFIQSGLGRHVTERASIEVEEALAELVEADPNDAKLIAQIQTRIKVAAQSLNWLTEAISEGENAMKQLNEEE